MVMRFYRTVVLFTFLHYMVEFAQSASVQQLSNNEIDTNKNGKAPCIYNYSPCTCTNSFGIYVICDGIELEQVRQVFLRTSEAGAQYSDSFALTVPTPLNNEDIRLTIPADLMGNQTAGFISITCPSALTDKKYQLEVDLESFQYSGQLTTAFSISGCELDLLDLSFLTRFEVLSDLFFGDSINVQTSLMSLPVLPSLTYLAIVRCPDFGSTNLFPKLNSGLTELLVGENGWNDEIMSRILDWTLESSIDSMEVIITNGNALSAPPQQIARFTRLTFLWLRNNTVPITLKNGSLTFEFPVSDLDVSNNPQLIIEDGAFQGNYGAAAMNLENNNLSRFEQSIFYPVLQNMPTYGIGYVDVRNNPFDCDNDICHLAWLILDYPELLPYVHHGKCSNGIPFERLSENNFINCP